MTYDEKLHELLNDFRREECVGGENYVAALERWRDLLVARIREETRNINP